MRDREHEQAPPDAAAQVGHVPWGLLDCLGVLAVTAVVVVVLANVIALVDALLGLPQGTDIVLLPLPLVVLAAVTLLWVRVRHRAVEALGGPVRGRAREWAVGVGVGAAAFLAVNLVLGTVIQLAGQALGVDLPEVQPGIREATARAETLPWMLLSAVVVAPLAEELFFRGLLYQALRRRWGPWPAILSSAVLFAGAHLAAEGSWAGGVLAFVMIFPLGVLLAWLFERRGGLTAPIAVHATFNGVTLLLVILVAGEGVMASGVGS